MDLETGKNLRHYLLIEKIGAGGMGDVYRATDTELGRDVALKVLPSEMASDPGQLERFRREAKALAALDHPNIVTVFSIERDGDTHFFTMALVTGRTVDRLVPAGGMALEPLLDVALPIVDALAAAHGKGVIHRDLKPANVMVSDDGRVKVLDFGLAKRAVESTEEEAVTQSLGLTQSGFVLGTLPYMSPEQVEGRTVDPRSDLFSLGVVLYELATGARPFQADSVAALISAILRDTPPAVHTLRERFPVAFGRVVERCLAKHPDERYQTANEVADALRASRETATTAIAAEERRPFVGRDAERAVLDAALDSAKAGRGSLILLGGEPGVGKTRLAAEILADGRARGVLALTGHSYEEEGTPFVTTVEILEDMVREVPGDDLRDLLGDSASEISRILPDLRQRFPDIAETQELPPEHQRRHLFNAVLDFLRRVSADRPMVLLCDDLHWADESSLLMLEHLAPHLPAMSVLILGTYRDVELDVRKPFEKTLARLVRQSLARRLPIKRLAEADVAALLAELGGAAPPADLVRVVYRETDGNPFFATEVFQHLVEEGRLFDETGAWRRDLVVKQLEVPEGVRLVIGRRLERLRGSTPKVLTTAAVIGMRFDLPLLLAAVGGDEDEVLDAVDEAVAAKLLTTTPARRDPRYEFVHALVRHTLLDGLSMPRQQRVHLKIASAMEQVFGKRAEEHAADLAHHLYQAGGLVEPARVRRYLVLAGKTAQTTAAVDEAADYFDRALETLEFEDDSDPAERADILFLRGLARRTLGRWEEGVADWNDALPLLEAAGRGELVARICRDIAYKYVWENRSSEARQYVDRGLRAVGDQPSSSRCRLLAIDSYAHSVAGELAEAEQVNDRALAMAEALGDEALLAGEVLLSRLYLFQHSFRFGKMAETGERAVPLLRRLNRSWDLSNALGGTLLAWALQGRFDLLTAHIDEAVTLAVREGDLGNQFHAEVVRSFVELSQGNVRGSRDGYRDARAFAREAEFPWWSVAQALQGVGELQMGEWDAARATLDDAMSQAVSGTWRGFEPAARLLVLAYAGDGAAPAELERLIPELPVVGQVGRSGAWTMTAPVLESALLLGRQDVAAGLYPAMRQAIDQGCRVFWSYGLTERFAGMAAAAAGDRSAAERHFETALEQVDAFPFLLDRPEILRWRATMWIGGGRPADRARATEDLTAARSDYERFGMPRHVTLVNEALGKRTGGTGR